MTIYYIDENTGERNTAGSKAPSDIAKICKINGYKALMMPEIKSIRHPRIRHIEELISLSIFWKKVFKTVNEKDVLIYQHPTLGKPIAFKYLRKIIEIKRCRVIVVIHDLETLRGGISGQIKVNNNKVSVFEKYILHNSAGIISHNYRMTEYLSSIGVNINKVVNLELFDYLDGTQRESYVRAKTPSIAIAGNLSSQKSGYIYKINETTNKELMVNLYGVFLNKDLICDKNSVYHGSFSPEELGKVMQGDFGLVWDGPSIKACEGNTGEYLKYNNPHKASMYLSAGIPIVTWKEAAISKFVEDNKVGIVLDNLNDIQEVIRNISDSEYNEMIENVRDISKKLKDGYYFKIAIKKAINNLVE